MPDLLIDERLLDEKLAGIERARNWSPRVISRLEIAIRTAEDFDLFRINPVQFAQEKGLDEDEAIALFLHAVKAGLFEMEWHLVCASCGHIVESLANMARLHAHYTCDMCNAENEASLDDYIHVTFTISPAVRPITYHEPEALPVEDFYFKYQFCKNLAPLHNGLRMTEILKGMTKVLSYLPPGSKTLVELDLVPGNGVRGNDITTGALFVFAVSEPQEAEEQRLRVMRTGEQFQVVDPSLSPYRMDTPNFTFDFKQVGELPASKAIIEIENAADDQGSVWIVEAPLDLVPPRLEFESFLSGKKLLAHQTFRDLFRSEVVDTPEGIGVNDATYLFTDLKGSTELYDQVGDPKAFYLVRQHFDALSSAVSANSGAIVKTIGDAVMATFMNPLDAMRAALDMLEEIETLNRNISEKLVLKIGIHKGPSIVVNMNDRLDYFGQSVNIASRIQGLAGAGEIYISQEVCDHPGVRAALAGFEIAPEQALVKGVRETLEVYRVSAKREQERQLVA